jgi:hypothetical protein
MHRERTPTTATANASNSSIPAGPTTTTTVSSAIQASDQAVLCAAAAAATTTVSKCAILSGRRCQWGPLFVHGGSNR